MSGAIEPHFERDPARERATALTRWVEVFIGLLRAGNTPKAEASMQGACRR
jgi:hypothetical protein